MNVKINNDFEVRPVPVWDAGKQIGTKPKGYEPMVCKTTPGRIWMMGTGWGLGIIVNAIKQGTYFNTPKAAMEAYQNARQITESNMIEHFNKNR